MPKGGIVEKESWVKHFRNQIKLTCSDNWYVTNNRGRIRLKVEGLGSVSLPYDWTEKGAAQAIDRIKLGFKRHVEAKGKFTLAAIFQQTQASSSKNQINWNALVNEYKEFIENVSENTWKKSYYRDPSDKNMKEGKIKAPPVLNRTGQLMDHPTRKPIDGTFLMMKSIKHWEKGTRGRQIARRVLKRFLEWAVMRGKLPAAYAPPATVPQVIKDKRLGFALSDSQILRLLDGLSDERWRFAVQLAIVFGLRPEELRYLVIKEGIEGKELWCTYRKSMGGLKGAKTKPRRLHPLLVLDSDGNAIDWKLQSRVEIGETMPALGKKGKGSEALGTYLRRTAIWKVLKEEALQVDEELTPYTFRHRYAKQSHAAGFPLKNICFAMGHTAEVHLGSYARYIPEGTSDLYAKRNAVKAA